MKLFNSNLSPYASRVRIAVYAKNLPVEIVSPPGGTGSAEYKKLNPTGKVPALEIDGAVLPESEVINEFLEDRFPTPSLRPADPLARARMRVLSRFPDLYLAPALSGLFGQMNPKTRDAKLVAEKLAELGQRLDQLEQLVVAAPYAAGPELSLADCALAPVFFFLTRLLPALGAPSPLDGRPKLAKVGEAVGKHPAVSKVLAEMGAAMAERFGAGNR
ncbi:MAG TPA: glutathione S-transferase family protein [Myxococcota bacterium]|nr:glutathione S-transferase family protein [Myxococcota bacterium]